MLQNIHLMPRWLVELEKILDSFSGDTRWSHINFRLLLSAEPSTGALSASWTDPSNLLTSLPQVSNRTWKELSPISPRSKLMRKILKLNASSLAFASSIRLWLREKDSVLWAGTWVTPSTWETSETATSFWTGIWKQPAGHQRFLSKISSTSSGRSCTAATLSMTGTAD